MFLQVRKCFFVEAGADQAHHYKRWRGFLKAIWSMQLNSCHTASSSFFPPFTYYQRGWQLPADQ